MKCCSIKLADRTEVQQFLLKRKEIPCHSMILDNGDTCSRFELSNYKLSSYPKDEPPQLSVLNISLPRDVKAFNTGASLQRWTNKRPRLKSARNSAKSAENSNTYTFDVSILIEEFCNEYHLEETTDDIVSTNDSTEQIHPDIQRLLDVTHEGTDETSKKENAKAAKRNNAKQRHKKKKKKCLEEVKEIIVPKKKITKTVSFSLSKPPTPQTEQIIRVDIVSNYSVDIEISENSNKGKNVKQEQLPKIEKNALIELLSESNKREAKNLVVESKKVVLYQRDMDSNKNV